MKIRHEINLLNGLSNANSAGTPTSNERVLFSPAKYSGTLTVYFEIVAQNTSPTISYSCVLYSITAGANVSNSIISVPANNSAFAIYRTVALSLTTEQELAVSGNLSQAKAARLVIIQDTGTDALISSESQFEIGNRETGKTNTTSQYLTNPKHFKWEPSKYDGKVDIYYEVVARVSDAMQNYTVALDASTNGGTSFDVGFLAVVTNGTNTTPQRTRVLLIGDALNQANWAVGGTYDGALMKLWTQASSSMVTHDVYCAKIIIVQTTQADKYEAANSLASSPIGRNAAGYRKITGQSFTANGGKVTKVSFKLRKIGTPTGTFCAKLFAHTGTFGAGGTGTGTELATSDSMNAADVSTDAAFTTYTFNFPTPYQTTAGVKYCIVLEYLVDSLNNYINVYAAGSSPTHAGSLVFFDAAWGAATGADLWFIMIEGEITKTQEQYLMVNTSTSINGNADALTKWDPGEWSDVTNDHYFIAEGPSGTLLDPELRYGSTTVTGSTITDLNRYESSAVMTMPSGVQTLDTYLPSSGSFYASRILVNIEKYVAPPASNPCYSYTFIL